MDYRAALVDFYRKHNPLKLVEVDALLRKYRGREEELLHALRVKYKVNEKGESIEEETPPAPPPPPPPPPRERPAPRMEAIRNDTPREEPRIEEPRREESKWEEPAPRMEAVRNEPAQEETYEEETKEEAPVRPRRDAEITRSVNDYSSDYKGNTAAERAAYWRKELEKREQERRGKKRDEKVTETREKRKEEPVQKSESKPKAKVEKMKVVREPEVEIEGEEPEVQEEKKNPRAKIAIFVIAGVLLVIAVIFALSNETVQSKLGLTDTPEEVTAEDKAKKTGLDPAVMTATEDSAKTGEFALEGDESEERVPSVEDAMNEKPSSSSNETSRPSREEPRDEPAAPAGEVVRRKFYIGCAAVASKQTAEAMASELRRKGFDNAGYFYIPDFDPAGKELYRIYVGPFESVESAEETAVNVRAESPSAYTFFLK